MSNEIELAFSVPKYLDSAHGLQIPEPNSKSFVRRLLLGRIRNRNLRGGETTICAHARVKDYELS